jgi:hypothetical protein
MILSQNLYSQQVYIVTRGLHIRNFRRYDTLREPSTVGSVGSTDRADVQVKTRQPAEALEVDVDNVLHVIVREVLKNGAGFRSFSS